MATKSWVFCNGTMKLFFVVTGQIGMKFGQKRQSVSSVEPCKNYENFPLRGDFAPKPPFCGCFDGSPCDRPTSQGLRFSTSLRIPSVTGRANGVPALNRLFVRLTISAVEAPKVTQILLSEP